MPEKRSRESYLRKLAAQKLKRQSDPQFAARCRELSRAWEVRRRLEKPDDARAAQVRKGKTSAMCVVLRRCGSAFRLEVLYASLRVPDYAAVTARVKAAHFSAAQSAYDEWFASLDDVESFEQYPESQPSA